MRFQRSTRLRTNALVFGCGAAALSLLCGCPPMQGPRGGTTDYARSTEEIVRTVNANASKIDRPVYAQPVHVLADFTDDYGHRRRFNLDGALLVRKPRDFRLDLKHPLGERVLQVGSNENDYWCWIVPEVATYWWGRHQHAGKTCADSVPLRPEQLAEALGMNELPDDPQQYVGPLRLFGNQYDRLLFSSRNQAGGLSVEREYWVDRKPPYLIRVVLFRDEYGRRGMSAVLDDYRALWRGGPYLAHKISVMWPPDSGRTEGGQLELVVDRWGPPPGRISPRAFVRPPEAPPGVARMIQVDLACDGKEGIPARSRPPGEESSMPPPGAEEGGPAPADEAGSPPAQMSGPARRPVSREGPLPNADPRNYPPERGSREYPPDVPRPADEPSSVPPDGAIPDERPPSDSPGR